MPEGPEIHGQALRLAAVLQDKVPIIHAPYLPALETLQGQKIVRVESWGKAFLLRFESGLTLYAHMQLYGRWTVAKAGPEPNSRRQLRLRLATPNQQALLYSATDIELLTPEQLLLHPYLRRLGPDLLDLQVASADFLGRMQDRRFQGRQLAALLLDQTFWAGPGNYLRSEILFCAGLSPELRPRDLSEQQRRDLVRAAQGLSLRSLQTKGLTNHPRQVQVQRQQGQPRRQYRHWVFNREGSPCLICGSKILKEVWSGRRLYRCCDCGGGGSLEMDFPELAVALGNSKSVSGVGELSS